MDKETKQELYSSPKVKVVEIKERKVLCQSGTPEQYKNGEWTW